jgi:dTDP-4-amino-4,6-dideoxygalactose transaminase
MIKFLDIYRQDKLLHKKILGKIQKLFKKNDFINGDEVKIFEKNFSRFCQTKYCSGVGNGTDALYIALKSLNLKNKDEIILPAMTYKSTLLSVTGLGLKPILVDIEHNSSGICIKDLEKKISNKTKAVICVSLYGNPVKFDKIKRLIKSKKRKIFLIEDAAQAHGAIYKDKPVGSFGDVSCFSFYPGKNLGAYGDAGAILTDHYSIYKKIELIKNLGSLEKFNCFSQSVNSRLDTIQAIVLNEKLKKLNIQNKKRVRIASLYNELIVNKKIKKLKWDPGCVFHQYVILSNNRTKLIKIFKKNNIQYGLHYPISINNLFFVKKKFKGKLFPNAENLAKKGLSLPVNPELKLRDIKKISNILNSF